MPADNRPGPPQKSGDGERPGGPAPRNSWNETAVLLARLSGIGWFVAASIGGGVALGWFLDRQLGASPVLTLIGLGLGILVAFTGMFRLLNAFGSQKNNKSNKE